MIFRHNNNTLELEDEIGGDSMCIEIQPDYSDAAYTYIDKEKAIQIVNHLITVFEITPEQRTNDE